jgi:hypothetical protein
LVGRPEGRKPLGTPRWWLENNIKMDRQKVRLIWFIVVTAGLWILNIFNVLWTVINIRKPTCQFTSINNFQQHSAHSVDMHELLHIQKKNFLLAPFFMYFKIYKKKSNKMQQCIKIVFIPDLYETQHVSGDTPSIIRSLKPH